MPLRFVYIISLIFCTIVTANPSPDTPPVNRVLPVVRSPTAAPADEEPLASKIELLLSQVDLQFRSANERIEQLTNRLDLLTPRLEVNSKSQVIDNTPSHIQKLPNQLGPAQECLTLEAEMAEYRFKELLSVSNNTVKECIDKVLLNASSLCLVYFDDDPAPAKLTNRYFIAYSLLQCYEPSIFVNSCKFKSKFPDISNCICSLEPFQRIMFDRILSKTDSLCCFYYIEYVGNITLWERARTWGSLVQSGSTGLWEKILRNYWAVQSIPEELCSLHWTIEGLISQLSPIPSCFNANTYYQYESFTLSSSFLIFSTYGYLTDNFNAFHCGAMMVLLELIATYLVRLCRIGHYFEQFVALLIRYQLLISFSANGKSIIGGVIYVLQGFFKMFPWIAEKTYSRYVEHIIHPTNETENVADDQAQVLLHQQWSPTTREIQGGKHSKSKSVTSKK